MRKLITLSLIGILYSCGESDTKKKINIMESYVNKMKSAGSIQESKYWQSKVDSMDNIISRMNDSISKSRK
jgi:hypothetical protein